MFKNIVKKIFLLVLLVTGAVLPFHLKGEEEPYFELLISEDTQRFVHGVEHRKIVAQLKIGTRISNQVINYTGANIKEDPNLFAVVGDNYLINGYGASNLRAQTYQVNMSYLNQARVVSAVNGDFFNINPVGDQRRYGMTSAAHIRDYRTIHAGSAGRIVVSIDDDGNSFIGPTEFKGFHVVVLDDSGSRKLKDIKIDGFNRYPEEGEVTAFFSNYEQTIVSPDKKMVFNGVDTKVIESNVYFSEGNNRSITTDDVELENDSYFVLMGDVLFEEGLITENDTVLIQNVIGGIHEGVRSAVGGNAMLVTGGEVVEHENKDVHPRTAAGIKEDGTLFAVTVDGRQPHNDMDGVDYEQLGYIMKFFGAVEAANLDGGGSTTMLFYDENTDFYETQNSPSDNPMSLRAVANGLFFLHGNLEPQLPPSPFPDTRDILGTPSNLYFDNKNILRFDKVPNALYYIVTVNGRTKHRVEDNFFDLGLSYGEYDFVVKAFGDFDFYKQSSDSDVFNAAVYSNTIYDFIEGLRKYGQNAK